MSYVYDGPITSRLHQVLVMVSLGMTDTEIATELCVSKETVKTHVRQLLFRLDARTRAHAVAIACQQGLLA